MTPTAPYPQLGRFVEHCYAIGQQPNGRPESTYFPTCVRVAMFRLTGGGLRCLVDFTRNFEILDRRGLVDVWLPGSAYLALYARAGGQLHTGHERSVLRIEITNFDGGFTNEFLLRVQSDLVMSLGRGFESFVGLLRQAETKFFDGPTPARSGHAVYRCRTPEVLEVMRCRLYELVTAGRNLVPRQRTTWTFDSLEYLWQQWDWWSAYPEGVPSLARRSFWHAAGRNPRVITFMRDACGQAISVEQARQGHPLGDDVQPVQVRESIPA